MTRKAGLLCPLFSVPGNQGIGDFGGKTLKMIDCIADAGYSVWQILPLQMTAETHSPYKTYSSYAGDPIYINLDRLSEEGLLTQSSIVNCNKFKDRVDYNKIREFKEPYFVRAFKAFKKNFKRYKEEYEKFEKEAFWLDDWAVYQLFSSFHDGAVWNEWDEEYRNWPEEHAIDLDDYQDELFYVKFLQFIFYKQFDEVLQYAHSRNVKIMGDVPFYVGYDSADVWAEKRNFMLDEDGNPTFVAGCPPDYFSKDGQLWGMPIYNFAEQKKDNYKFWCERMNWTYRCFDLVRIDHFRAFDTYWMIPAGHPTAVNGHWEFGPGHELLQRILETSPGIELIAEDLGYIRQEVLDLEKDFNLPGMDVLIFRMEPKLLKKPAEKNKVVYSGTHDNPTLDEEYKTYSPNKRTALRRFFKKRGYESRNFNDLVCHYLIDCEADFVILSLWDVCGYSEEARINRPGLETDLNWSWKLKNFKTFPAELMKTRPWLEQAGRIVKK